MYEGEHDSHIKISAVLYKEIAKSWTYLAFGREIWRTFQTYQPIPGRVQVTKKANISPLVLNSTTTFGV